MSELPRQKTREASLHLCRVQRLGELSNGSSLRTRRVRNLWGSARARSLLDELNTALPIASTEPRSHGAGRTGEILELALALTRGAKREHGVLVAEPLAPILFDESAALVRR